MHFHFAAKRRKGRGFGGERGERGDGDIYDRLGGKDGAEADSADGPGPQVSIFSIQLLKTSSLRQILHIQRFFFDDFSAISSSELPK